MTAPTTLGCLQEHSQTPAEVRNRGTSFKHILAAAELLDSLTSVVSDPTGVTISNTSINEEAFVNDFGHTIPAGKGVLWTATGGVSGQVYQIIATAITDSVPPQTFEVPAVLRIV